MSRDSTLILDDRDENWVEYRDRTSGEVRWLVINRQSNHHNIRLSRYLVYDKRGDLVITTPLNSRWGIWVFIAEQEGTYANHERMVEYMKKSRTVKVIAPWADPDEKKLMAKAYIEKMLDRRVSIRKIRAVHPYDYYRVMKD